MKAMRVKNLRSLTDTNDIKIKPLTVLVGKNGSGKSTFARLFPLLRQSVEVNTKGPILWYGRHVDYGSYKESVNNKNNESPISLKFSMHFSASEINEGRYFRFYYYPFRTKVLEDLDIEIEFCVLYDEIGGKTYVSSLFMDINSDIVKINIDRNGAVTEFTVNKTDIIKKSGEYSVWQYNELIPAIKSNNYIKEYSKNPAYINRRLRYAIDFNMLEAAKKELSSYFHGSTHDNTKTKLVNNLYYCNAQKFYSNIKDAKGGEYYSKQVAYLSKNNVIVDTVRDLITANLAEQLTYGINDTLVEIFSSVYYIEPIRATAERYYREQDLSVDEIDSKGHNLPMFLKSLTDIERERFKIWTLSNLGVEINAKREGGHIAITITEEESRNEYNLSDTGFGFSQILPIVAQLWALAERPKSRQYNTPIILTIEQPELHLHPAHQAKIADMLIASIDAAKAAGVDVRIIIETHSESIINRLGELSERLKFKDMINVVVFEKNTLGQTNTYEAYYDDDGSLVNWPYGFFMP